MITYDIDLCIGMKNQGTALTVKCCDTGVNIRVHLFVCRKGIWTDTHEPYSIPEGCVPVLRIAKPDKTYFVKDGKVDGGDVLFDAGPQAFTASGTATAEVSLYAETGKRITSATFAIEVPPECTSKCEGESGNYVDVMSEQIRAAIDAADKAESAAIHTPIIQGDTWWVWDFDAGEYVDTGAVAVPKDGKDGHTPVKGEDYFTQEDIDEISDVFIAEYGVTTITELEEAFNAGKMLFCKDGAYISPLYQKSSAGSFSFYSNDSANQTNRYCTAKNIWNKKTTALCSGAIADIQEELSRLTDELETVKQELEALKQSGGGNGNIITFYVDGEAYRAERGMTWEQFVASDYNPDKYFDCCDYVGKMFDIYKGDIEYEDYVFINGCCGPPSFLDTGEMPTWGYDVIMEGHNYITWQ